MVRTSGEKDRSSNENMADGCDRKPKDGEIKTEVERCYMKDMMEKCLSVCVSLCSRDNSNVAFKC